MNRARFTLSQNPALSHARIKFYEKENSDYWRWTGGLCVRRPPVVGF